MRLQQRCLPSTSSTLRKYAVSCLSICLAHTMEPETGGKSLTMLILHDLLCGYWTWEQQHKYSVLQQTKIRLQNSFNYYYNCCFCFASPVFCFVYVYYLHIGFINGTCAVKPACKEKGKPVPLHAWTGPERSRKLSFPDFMTTAQDGGKVVSLTHRPPLPPGNTPGTHFC